MSNGFDDQYQDDRPERKIRSTIVYEGSTSAQFSWQHSVEISQELADDLYVFFQAALRLKMQIHPAVFAMFGQLERWTLPKGKSAIQSEHFTWRHTLVINSAMADALADVFSVAKCTKSSLVVSFQQQIDDWCHDS